MDFVNKFDCDGFGSKKGNFWNNLIDFRKEFVYKESVYQGNIHLLKENQMLYFGEKYMLFLSF